MKAQLLKKDGKPEFAVLPIMEYRGLLQRMFTLAIFPPIGVAAYALAGRIRQGSRRSGL